MGPDVDAEVARTFCLTTRLDMIAPTIASFQCCIISKFWKIVALLFVVLMIIMQC